MARIEVEATAGKGEEAKTSKVHFNCPDTVGEFVAQYGEQVAYNHLKGSVIVSLQSFVRSKMTGKTPLHGKALQDAVDAWKPGIRQPGKPASEKVKESFAKLSPEERKALIRELRG